MKEHQCDFCPMSYDNPQSLQKHRRKHTNVKPFQCKQCKKRFMYLNCYNKHVEMECNVTSRLIRNQWMCSICHVVCVDKQTFRLHQLEHSNKLFECKFCGKRFTRNYNLGSHIRSRHAGK